MRADGNTSRSLILTTIVVLAIGVLCSSSTARLAASSGLGPATGSPQLVSIQELPEGEMCAWPEPGGASLMASLEQDPNSNLFAALQREQRAVSSGSGDADSTTEFPRPVARIIRDTDPIFS